MKDITTRADIELLVNTFYERVRKSSIGFLFDDVAHTDWSHHLPNMYNFWEMTLLGTATFSGNVMQKHFVLHHQHPLTTAHFDTWMQLFEQTVRELFAGDKAEEAIRRALDIRRLMEYRVIGS